jgi:hypothetical protein
MELEALPQASDYFLVLGVKLQDATWIYDLSA